MIVVALLGSLILDTISFAKSRSQGIDGWVDTKPNGWYVFKFMMTISITVTFSLYLTLLAPFESVGFVNAYMRNGASSLCVHAIAPLLAIVDFLLFDYQFHSTPAHLYCSTIPPLAYVAGIVALHYATGMTWGKHHMVAPYSFLNFGAPAGWFGFAPNTMNVTTLGVGIVYLLIIFSLIFVGIGAIFLALKNRRQRRLVA